MMISTKGRYALRVLVDMAEHQAGGCYVPLREIAARQEISEKYLESIVKLLVHENILLGVRGKGGGYRLNGEPDQFNRPPYPRNHGGFACACRLSRRAAHALRPHGQLPHIPDVVRSEQAHLRLSGKLYDCRPDAHRGRRI